MSFNINFYDTRSEIVIKRASSKLYDIPERVS